MMIPSVGTPIGFKDILNGFLTRKACADFTKTIANQTRRKHVLLANSGTTAYFLILKALQRLSNKKEVILPAYTAPSLILPIQKAGLIPRLCDIDLKTFNMDLTALPGTMSDDTLAITIVHMFGLPQWFESAVQEDEFSKSSFIIEDLASAQGATLNGRPVGSFGDVSFVSFNRGKNFATLTGGAVGTDQEDISRLVMEEGKRYLLQPAFMKRIGIILKAIALSLAVRPWFYTMFRSFIAQFKYQGLHDDFAMHAYTRFQAGMGNSALQKSCFIFEKRFENGLHLHRALAGVDGITIPVITDGSIPVFNQFPLLIDNQARRDIIFKALVARGIEATILYPKPIHRIYNLGYDRTKDPFPNATYLARRIILIPTHPFVKKRHLQKAVDTIIRNV
jgi:dTDP-4-amino-4,6-dideoxygalactose transaminase